MSDQIILADCRTGIASLPDGSVQCCVTSPPYYGLRDYGMAGQMGLEETPEAFIADMVKLFREVRRVLADDGTLWLNIGDSYTNGGAGRNDGNHRADGRPGGMSSKATGVTNQRKIPVGLKQKDLIGIPWMLAFALRADGWYLRQDIIWSKPNPMPESVTDRCTKAHEYIFLLSKSAQYYYDADSIRTPITGSSMQRLNQDIENQAGSVRGNGGMKHNGPMKAIASRRSGNKERKDGVERGCPSGSTSNVCGSVPWEGVTANKRSVWTVTTKPFKEAHFATFPPELIVDCIKAGCPEGGIVLDPFMGAGTTALVAKKLNRHYVGFELNPEYIAIANKRLQKELGLFA